MTSIQEFLQYPDHNKTSLAARAVVDYLLSPTKIAKNSDAPASVLEEAEACKNEVLTHANDVTRKQEFMVNVGLQVRSFLEKKGNVPDHIAPRLLALCNMNVTYKEGVDSPHGMMLTLATAIKLNTRPPLLFEYGGDVIHIHKDALWANHACKYDPDIDEWITLNVSEGSLSINWQCECGKKGSTYVDTTKRGFIH